VRSIESTTDAKAVVARFVEEVWNRGRLEVADDVLDRQYVEHSASAEAPAKTPGPEGIKRFVQMFRTAFPDIVFSIDEMIAEGDRVAVRLTGVGTHQGRLGDLPPTGRRVRIGGAAIHHVRDGRIAETYEFVDRMALRQQLGAPDMPALEK
jgi:steroid delta-isomerase-like uncharacterized protein